VSAQSRRLRFGVLGLGIAGGIMAPYLAQHPRTCVAGAADRHAGLRQRFEQDFGVPTDDDAAALLRRPEIDAVYIATPHQFHREHALMAAELGKHVIVEKPMALTLADCDAMIEAAQRHGVTLIVGHTNSFDPAIGRLHQLAVSGEFGRLAMLLMWNYTDFLYRPRRPEELDTRQGGGILFNQVPHQIDIARLLAGAPLRSVRAMTATLDPRRPTEGCCTALLDFSNGVAASLTYSGYDHFDSDELHGWISSIGRPKQPRHGATRRSLLALPDGAHEQRQRSERYGYGGDAYKLGPRTHQSHFGTLIATFERADVRTTPAGLAIYHDDGVSEISLPPEVDGRVAVLDEFCAAVLDGRPAVHDGEFGRGTVEASLALLDSVRQRRGGFLC